MPQIVQADGWAGSWGKFEKKPQPAYRFSAPTTGLALPAATISKEPCSEPYLLLHTISDLQPPACVMPSCARTMYQQTPQQGDRCS